MNVIQSQQKRKHYLKTALWLLLWLILLIILLLCLLHENQQIMTNATLAERIMDFTKWTT